LLISLGKKNRTAAQTIVNLIAVICHAALNFPRLKILLQEGIDILQDVINSLLTDDEISTPSLDQDSQSPPSASISFELLVRFASDVKQGGRVYPSKLD
jgi:hypothetical protein